MHIKTRQISLSALFLALCVLVPIVFHILGLGRLFLPIFLPILLAGFVLDFPYAILVGLAGPWVSALITGMPPLFPTAVIMSVEGMTAASIISYFYKKRKSNFWVCLISALVGERVAYVLMLFVFLPLLGFPAVAVTIGAIVSLPGIALQGVLIPLILSALKKRNVIYL
ncbi:MAG: ECF transporter S component [Candidatus Zhuqueibacterota bacterium]